MNNFEGLINQIFFNVFSRWWWFSNSAESRNRNFWPNTVSFDIWAYHCQDAMCGGYVWEKRRLQSMYHLNSVQNQLFSYCSIMRSRKVITDILTIVNSLSTHVALPLKLAVNNRSPYQQVCQYEPVDSVQVSLTVSSVWLNRWRPTKNGRL